jgi:hypothetical protein
MSSEKYSIFGNNKINRSGIFRKWMIRLRINFATGNERRIDTADCIRPLKTIRFDRICDRARIKVTKSNAFKGLESKDLFQGNISAFRETSAHSGKHQRIPVPLPKTSRPLSGL